MSQEIHTTICGVKIVNHKAIYGAHAHSNDINQSPKKQTTKLRLQVFEKLYYIVEKSKTTGQTLEPDETAHLDLQCLQNNLLCLALYC